MPLTLLAITSTVILTLAVSASESRAADTKASSSPPSMVAGAVKAPPARNTGRQVAAPAKASDGDLRAVRHASGSERDDQLLGLLWLLMGSSRRR